jgi:hypothetical protein
MAIKGKGRTKTRQPVRAPRREPVPVPVPWVQRRWVQLTAAFVAGLLIFMGGVWLTNGLRDQDEAGRSTRQELERRRAGSAWQTLVDNEVGKLGDVSFEAPPVILQELTPALEGLAERTPTDVAPTLRRLATDAKRVQDAIEAFDLSGTVAGKGFTSGEVLRYLSARDELVTALTLYRQAASIGVAASRLDVGEREPVLAQARATAALAQAALTRFQTHQIEALNAAGIQPQQPGIPGLPGS